MRKHIIKPTSYKKGSYKDYVIIFLSITNSLHESLKPMHILWSLVSSNY